MATLNSKSIYRVAMAKVLAWGAFAFCLTASPLTAQNTVGGNFTLNENTRFGNSVLGAGQYSFSIEPIGTLLSVRSIQQGAGHLVLVVLKPEKSGPDASMFAMASPSDRSREASELILKPEKEEMMARSMYLEKDGLVVNFNWANPQAKHQGVARQTVPLQSAATPRTAGTY
jgi:hypothetical protein